jgi:hypothetical protein
MEVRIDWRGLPWPTTTNKPVRGGQKWLDELLGLMKEEIAADGGTEDFIRWVKYGDDDEEGI